MIKFALKIRTRGGTVVDNLMIAARDRSDVERKVMQIYHNCEILECSEATSPIREETMDLEKAINLINKESGPEDNAGD